MSDPFIGEIAVFPYVRYLPYGWLACDGSTFTVGQFPALFSIIGNRFGGVQGKTFSLPNLKGNVLIGPGLPPSGRGSTNFPFGSNQGAAAATANLPAHTHQLVKHPPKFSGTAQKVATPAPNTELAQFGNTAGSVNYNIFAANGQQDSYLSTSTFQPAFDGAQQHENRQPFLAMCYAIAWDGTYPVHP